MPHEGAGAGVHGVRESGDVRSGFPASVVLADVPGVRWPDPIERTQVPGQEVGGWRVMRCERCKGEIANGHFYIEARRREGKPFIPPRPGIDNGLNLDPFVYIHIPGCDVYAS